MFDQFISSRRKQMAAHVGSDSAFCRTATKAKAQSTARPALSASCSNVARTTGSSPTARHPPTTSTFCAASCTATFRKPLILMTPKSLLRHKLAVSKAEEFTTGLKLPPHPLGRRSIRQLRYGSRTRRQNQTRRHVFGQSLLMTLLEERDARGIEDIYLLRVRTVLSLPRSSRSFDELSRFPNADVVWCQEEPKEPGRLDLHRPQHRVGPRPGSTPRRPAPPTCRPRRHPPRPRRVWPACTNRNKQRW